MNLENMDISPELREKVDACKTPEEILALAKKEGVKLTEEQLESISGGGKWTGGYYTECYFCGKKVEIDKDNLPSRCPNCGAAWHWD